MGFSGWLTLVFIILKLTGYIDWSWWWVLSPIPAVYILLAILRILLSVTETEADRKLRRAAQIFDKSKKK
jgi:hypothetical protein